MTVYYSFALRVLNASGLSASGVFVGGFNNSAGTQTNQPTVVGTRLYLRATNSGFNLGVSKNSSTATDWLWDSRTFTTNQTLFIVGSYTFNNGSSGDDVSQMWINPDSGNSPGSATTLAASLVNSNGNDLGGNEIASFVFQQSCHQRAAAGHAGE